MKRVAPELPSGTVTFVVVDVSLSYSATSGFENWLRICSGVRQIVDDVLVLHEGFPVLDRGSNHEFVYAFSRATRAVQGAVELQRKCLGAPVPGMTLPELRSAVYTGEADTKGGSYLGGAIDQAIGLKDLAYAHQVLIPLSTLELVRARVEQELSFRDLGNHQIHNTSRPERLFQVDAPGLPSEFPPVRSLESTLTNIAASRDSFVGRERELFEAALRLRSSRIVTITGPGGIGKSRLAAQLARSLIQEYADGAFLIDFGEVADGTFIPETVATELPFVDTVGVDLPSHLRDQLDGKQVLLILDNCEGLGSSLAPHAEVLFRGLRSADILITSRKPVGLDGETILELGALRTAEPGDDESYVLLLQRVKEVVPGFDVPAEHDSAMRDICRALGGVPFAIELAASKFRVLKIPEIRDQLLEITDGSISNRARDLQELVDKLLSWTYNGLPENERKVLRRLSVFASGWEAEEAASVCESADLTRKDVLRAEAMLVQKNLIRRVYKGPHVYRDNLCQSLWQFGHLMATEAGEVEPFKRRHLEWVAELADRSSTGLAGADQHKFIEKLDREKHNLRSAIAWGLRAGEKELTRRIVVGINLFWYKRGYITEGKVWLERLLSDTEFELSESRAVALNLLGVFEGAGGDSHAAIRYLDHAHDLAARVGANALVPRILANLGTHYRGVGDLDKAEIAMLRGVEGFREIGDEHRLAVTLSNFGSLMLDMRRYDEARAIMEESLALNRKLGNEWLCIMVEFNMAEAAVHQDKLDKAEPLLSQSLSRWYNQKDYRGMALAVRSMATMAYKLGQPERSAILLGAASALRDRLHQKLADFDQEVLRELVGQLTAKLGDGAFYSKWSEGNSLTPEAIVSFAIGHRQLAAG